MKALFFFLYISLVYCTTPSPPNIPTTAPAGWTLIYSEDFNVNATVGSFTNVGSSWNLSSPAAYVNSLFAYPLGWLDTSKNGQYNPSKTLSVDNSQLHIHLYAENTNFWVSAPLPALPTMTYGRYEECFRVSQSSGSYKVAWLLWPDSNLWPNDGEIDFPETNLNSTISAYMHFANASGGQDAYSTSVIISDGLWHVAITEWTAGQVLFYLDGNLIGNSTTQVPSKPMHRVWQSETRLSGGPPGINDSAIIDLAWSVVYIPSTAPTTTASTATTASTTTKVPTNTTSATTTTSPTPTMGVNGHPAHSPDIICFLMMISICWLMIG